ncbi:MAG: GNAT family N-acetyltransferase [Thermoplasmata archaeon]
MIREFRARDVEAFLAIYPENFPEEKYLGTDLAGMGRVLRRSFSASSRFLLRMARLVRRPIVRFFVEERDGHLVGTALLSFPDRAGFISLVQVDTRYRRQGIAEELMDACLEGTRSAHRPYSSLDVMESNTPARRLYEKLGYLPLHRQVVYLRETPEVSVPWKGTSTSALRAFTPSDAPTLVELAREGMSPQAREVLPPSPRQYRGVPLVSQALDSVSAAWVIDPGSGPVGFIRATSSRIMDSAHVTSPLFGPCVNPEDSRALVETAVAWTVLHGARRINTESPESHGRARDALTSVGFRELYWLVTLYRPVGR